MELHHRTSLKNQSGRALVAQGGPQDAHSPTGRGHERDALGLGLLKVPVVAVQHRLMQDQRAQPVQHGAAQIDIAGFDHALTLAFARTCPRVVATTDQAGAAKHLAGIGILGRVADGGRQTGHLDITQAFEFGPDGVRRLRQQVAQAVFQVGDVTFDLLQQSQVVL